MEQSGNTDMLVKTFTFAYGIHCTYIVHKCIHNMHIVITRFSVWMDICIWNNQINHKQL